MRHVRPGRLLAATLAAGGVLVLVVCAALFFGFRESDFHLARRSVAAPVASYEMTSPVEIGSGTGVHVHGGTIQLAPPPGSSTLTPVSHTLPDDGTAALVIDGGIFQIAGGEPAQEIDPVMVTAPLVDALRSLNFERLAVRRGTVLVALPTGNTETLTNVTADITARRKSSLSIRGNGTLRGQNVSFDVSGPSLLDRRPGATRALKAVVKSPLFQIAFDGRLGATDVLRLQGQAEVSVSNLRRTARWLGAAWPGGPGLQEMKITGDVDWQAPALAFDKATFQIDGNEATGTLALAFGGPRPNLTGTLAFKSLDLTKYAPQEIKGQFASLLPWLGTDDGEFPAPIGRQLDADVRISAGQVILPGMEMGRFAASVSLKGGRLLADIAEIGVDTGQGSGQVTANLMEPTPQVSVRGRLEGIDAQRATSFLLGHGALHGMSTITLDLTTRGGSTAELLSGLRGKATLSLREGGRIGIDMKSLMAAAQKADIEGWSVATGGQTTIDGLEAKLRVDHGVVASEMVQATTGESLLKAFGTISLVSRQIDLRVLLDAAPAAAARAQALAIPKDTLLLRGPWSAPTIQIER